MQIIHEPVKSSMIMSVGHDEVSRKCEIRFQNGKVYSYENVSREEYEALRDAPSVGKHFGEYWRNR